MSEIADELWKLARESRRLKNNPEAEAAHDKLQKDTYEKGDMAAYVRGVRELLDRFDS